ncbi:hypothetical protein FNF29_07214 [Cafeteria roenbergensis]|uniref:ApaG domain-containing protein n=1 Tax=Cafeteria roenbergensis TaxID=33653 RepID=A0A5A8C541_CAFRO|nr:hypothetical protein FNF29_07214 [Cafeteria roenbergensis]|eukprot:KAA0147659.1 hypothetical protein FNF29_07214 [Cafeteria roenbergensis]
MTGPANARIARALYGSFVQALRSTDRLRLVDPISLESWNTSLRPYRFVAHDPAQVLTNVTYDSVVGGQVQADGTVMSSDLLAAIRREFRAAQPDDNAIERGFACLRLLNEMLRKQTHQGSCRTRDVQVEMTTSYIPGSRYQFAYRARIRSLKEEGQLQLSSRHVVIHFGGARSGLAALEGRHGLQSGMIETPPDAPGVVGQQPVLGPGQTFEYFSGTSTLPHCCGTVGGSYGMVDLSSGERFSADIPTVAFEDPATVEKLRAEVAALDAAR